MTITKEKLFKAINSNANYFVEIIYSSYAENPLKDFLEDTELKFVYRQDGKHVEELQALKKAVEKEGKKASHKRKPISQLIIDTGKAIEQNAIEVYPLCKYEHSEVQYYIGEPSCHWDSGFVGYIAVFDSYIDKGYIEYILDMFNQYVNGNVYDVCIYDKNGKLIDFCCEFYDNESINNFIKGATNGEQVFILEDVRE